MKIYLFSPYFEPPTSGSPERYEFYKQLQKKSLLTDDFDKADYVFYMMHQRNCLNLPHDDNSKLDIQKITQIFNSNKKEVVIDYNDWTDTRNVPDLNTLKTVHKYFKRSIVRKEGSISKELVKYPREIIPISYGIRSDFVEYDRTYSFKKYNYDVCCMFNIGGGSGTRGIIPEVVNRYNGPKFVGRMNCPNRYGKVSTAYFEILKTSKIIITANPSNWEGDFRLWEALLMGNLVLCDEMLVPSLMTYPLINKKHLVYYNNMRELELLIDYYISNETERDKIGREGREFCLKHHKFSDRVAEVINNLE